MAIRKTKPPVRDGITYRDGAGTETHDGIDYPEEHRTYDELARGGRAMAKHHKESKAEERREEEHKEHEHERKKRATGGSVKLARGGAAKDGRSDEQGEEGSGDPEYFGGGESPTAKVAKGDRAAKRGGRMRKERKHGGRMEMEGKGAHHRLDRAAGGRARRAMGGKMTGSDSRPLTSASHLAAPKGDKRVPQDDPPTDDD